FDVRPPSPLFSFDTANFAVLPSRLASVRKGSSGWNPTIEQKTHSLRRFTMHRNWNVVLVMLAGIGLLTNAGCETPPPKDTSFSQWPAGASPQEVGKRIADNFAVRKLEFETNARRDYVIYPEVCAWYGSLTVEQLTKDNDLKGRLIQKF